MERIEDSKQRRGEQNTPERNGYPQKTDAQRRERVSASPLQQSSAGRAHHSQLPGRRSRSRGRYARREGHGAPESIVPDRQASDRVGRPSA